VASNGVVYRTAEKVVIYMTVGCGKILTIVVEMCDVSIVIVGQLFVSCVCQLLVSCRSAVGQLFVSCLSAVCQLPVSCLSAVGQVLVSCLSVCQLFVSCRSAVSHLLVSSRSDSKGHTVSKH
jgi:hypothetical protein